VIYARLKNLHTRTNKNNSLSIITETSNQLRTATKGTIQVIQLKSPGAKINTGKIFSTLEYKTDIENINIHNLNISEAGNYIIKVMSENADPVLIPYTITGKTKKPLTSKEIEIITQEKIILTDTVNVKILSTFKNGICFLQDLKQQKFIPLNIRNYQASLSLDLSTHLLPNGFLRVFMVHNGQIYTDQIELFTPPENLELNAKATFEKNTYKPKDLTSLKIKLTDHLGKPTKGNLVVAVYDKALEYVDHANAQQSLSRLWRHQHSIAPFSTSSLWQNEESFYHYYKHRLKPLISSNTFFLRSSYIISSGLYNDREIISFYARSASGRAFSFFGLVP